MLHLPLVESLHHPGGLEGMEGHGLALTRHLFVQGDDVPLVRVVEEVLQLQNKGAYQRPGHPAMLR